MRVALFTHQWPDVRLGGIGTYVFHTARALATVGHEPHIFTLTLDADARRKFPPGVIVHEVPTLAERVHAGDLAAPLAAALNAGGEGIYRLAIGWLLTSAFLDLHEQIPFDIVEAPDVEALGLPLLLDPDRNVPVVTHLHCCTAIAHQANNAVVSCKERLIQALEFAGIRLADGICAATQNVVESTGTFVEIERSPAIIPYPFFSDQKLFTAPPVDGPILFQGRLEWLKGCATIAAALNIFLVRNPTARFHFIGPDTSSGPGGGSMRRHILDTLSPTVADRVQILGEITRTRLDAEISASSFFVQPSLRENFSLVICEAMAAGRTVIVGDGTGSVDVVGRCGLIVRQDSPAELAAEMEGLFRDWTRLSDLSLRAYEHIRELCDPSSTATRRVEFYRRTVEQFQRQDGSPKITLTAEIANAVLPAISRVTAALVGASRHNQVSPGFRLRTICDRIAQSPSGANVLLYGAGKHTVRLMTERHVWEKQGHRVVGIVDDHPRFTEQPNFLGLPVQSLAITEQAARSADKFPPVVLSTDTYEEQFWENTACLREAGVSIFCLYSQRQSA